MLLEILLIELVNYQFEISEKISKHKLVFSNNHLKADNMYIKKLRLVSFRNFDDTTIEFQDGVNIIVGPNNSGKSNLIHAINLLGSTDKNIGSIHDFNKNIIVNNFEKYKAEPPIIKLCYYIEHSLSLDNFDDGILRIKNFIVFAEDGKAVADANNEYTINAEVELRYELDATFLQEYKTIMSIVENPKEIMIAMEKVIGYYSWSYYNTTSCQQIRRGDINNIFNIDLIPADRQTNSTLPQTRKFIKETIDEDNIRIDLKHKITDEINNGLDSVLTTIRDSINEEEVDIGISNGNHKIVSSFIYDSSFEQYFEFSLEDDELKYEIPMTNNGLGYNNLIQIFAVIKFRIDQDYNILLIEEPEAHLHPAMQYKLFQYLKKLKMKTNGENGEKVIKNQIFVTTHSPNISASADLDDMISLFYKRNKDANEYKVEAVNLKNVFKETQFKDAKNHLSKFLDVTRSDLFFTQKTILVEGLAEKLLMSAFAKKCGLDYDPDYNHISIVEVGGITLNHFLPLFLYNNNMVICFRDCDYDYYELKDNVICLSDIYNYRAHLTECNFLHEHFKNKNNIKLKTQMNYGSTFENELFLDNYDDIEVLKSMFAIVAPRKLNEFIESNNFEIVKWNSNISTLGNMNIEKKIKKLLPIYYEKFNSTTDIDERVLIEKLFFANLFLSYVENSKGDFALKLLTSELIERIKVPQYIREGLEWLQQ